MAGGHGWFSLALLCCCLVTAAGQACPEWPPSSSGQAVLAAQRAKAPLNVFTELTLEEHNAVFKFLLAQKDLGLSDLTAVNLTVADVRISYVHGIWYEMPPKSEVLAHIDKKAAMPARKARALLVLGKSSPPTVREVLVTLKAGTDGKPVASNLQRVNIHSSKWPEVPYNQRPHGVMDQVGQVIALTKVYEQLNAFIGAAFPGYSYGESCEPKCIGDNYGAYQWLSDDIQRAIYIWFFMPEAAEGDGGYIHPLPLQVLAAGRNDDLTSWEVTRWWFNGHFFDTINDLIRAWNADKDGMRSGFRMLRPAGAAKLFSNFMQRPGPRRGEKQPVGPISFEPYGRRFSIAQGNRVKWLGWELYVGYLPHYGPRYMDVRFKGERIAYEISMQEALASYGASDLSQANTVYLDSHWGIGASVRELVQGIDCPMTAAYMDAVTFYKGSSKTNYHKNAICVFEHNPDTPVLRHYSYSYQFYGAIPGASLVVRMVSEINNYDYIADLILSNDGMLEVKVVTSGYVQAAAFQNSYRKNFGYPLMFNISGTLHTHVLAWKVDLDIAGTSNSVNIHHMKVGEADDGAGGKIYINKYEAEIAETENEAAYQTMMLEPKLPVVINENKLNGFGSPRGYKVQLNRPLLNLEPPGYARSKALGFMKYSFAATKHKDGEVHSSSIYGQARLSNPSTSLTDYVDGEPLRNQDVVVWVNSGLYHIPVAEDAPVTTTTGNMLGFSLVPFNWANESPATDMADMVQIDTKNKEVPAVKKAVAALNCAPGFADVPFLESGFESA
uniref:Amine oxidase n=1 Tax=Tetradesmus obliquus TaxID=3088 RepID=A0A383WJJ4_TETOB|eukprot:jgi/Sobl393_1/1040/SZX77628.1